MTTEVQWNYVYECYWFKITISSTALKSRLTTSSRCRWCRAACRTCVPKGSVGRTPARRRGTPEGACRTSSCQSWNLFLDDDVKGVGRSNRLVYKKVELCPNGHYVMYVVSGILWRKNGGVKDVKQVGCGLVCVWRYLVIFFLVDSRMKVW